MMSSYRKCLFICALKLPRECMQPTIMFRGSFSVSTKIINAKESDEFWLKRLDHKDWLAPNELLKVFMHLKNSEFIVSAFEKASKRMDYKPSENLYTLLIDKLAHAKKFNIIWSLLEKAKEEKCRFSDDFFYRLIKIYGNVANNQEMAIITLMKMPEFCCWPTVKTFNCVLNMLVCNKQFEVVHEIFLSAPKLGVTLDTCCFNILIKGLCNWDKLDAAFLILDEIPKHGLRPNVKTYSALMHSLCKNGRVTEAFELYARMEKEKCHIDSIMFNVLISGLCNQGRVEEAVKLLKEMKLKGYYPNSGTYQALLYGWIGTKNYLKAKDFIFEMISENFFPSFQSYKLTIEGLCTHKLQEDVNLVLTQMISNGFVPRMGTWNKIVFCLFNNTGASCSPSSSIDLICSTDTNEC